MQKIPLEWENLSAIVRGLRLGSILWIVSQLPRALSRFVSKTQPVPARHAAAAGYQNQLSNFNVTLLMGRIYQCGRSVTLKCLD